MSIARSSRLRVLVIGLLACLALLWLRAAQLMILEHETLKQKADRQQRQVCNLPSLRGEIVDRRGHPLAFSVGSSSLAVDPTKLDEPLELAIALDRAGILPASEVLSRLDVGPKTEFVWLTRKVISEETVCRLVERFRPALIRFPEPKRLYPFGSALACVTGATGVDGTGLVGIEARFENALHGVDGKMIDTPMYWQAKRLLQWAEAAGISTKE